MAHSSALDVIPDDEETDLDYNLSDECSATTGSGTLCTHSDDDEVDSNEAGGVPASTSSAVDLACCLFFSSNHTIHSATYIPQDLLMLPTVNPVGKDDDKRPEQPKRQKKDDNKGDQDPYEGLSVFHCCFCPRFIREAPGWLKFLMILATCTMLCGILAYLGAALLHANNSSSGGSDHAPASQTIMEQDGDLVQWHVDKTSNLGDDASNNHIAASTTPSPSPYAPTTDP